MIPTYPYIGPISILQRIQEQHQGTLITSIQDIENWLKENNQRGDDYGNIVVTFVILPHYELRISDRHIEHVQCANGSEVLSAGEMTFAIDKKKVFSISQITNQSTGYCPAIESWQHVEKAIQTLDLPKPIQFEPAYLFSYCESCQSLKIIKDEDYFCYTCQVALMTSKAFQERRKYINFG